MRKDRLLFLAAALRADALNPKGVTFNLNQWIKPTGNFPPSLDCGTQACALGLAAMLPEFQAEGLSFRIDDGDDGIYSGRIYPQFEGAAGFNAGVKFFEISNHESSQLFDPYFYPASKTKHAEGENEVARRIEYLCANDSLNGLEIIQPY